MNKCIFLIGPPGAGKSTWLTTQGELWYDESDFLILSKERYSEENLSVILSTDDLIEGFAREAGTTYNNVFKDSIALAEKIFFARLISSVEWGDESIIIDRTNMSRKSRKRIMDVLGDQYEYEAVVFPAPEKVEWQRRLNSRPGKTIPENVIQGMLKSFEMPTKEEGFSKIIIIEPEN